MAYWTEVTDTDSPTVSKAVAGSAEDKNRDWHFTVKPDSAVSGVFGGMTFTDGAGSFTLKDSESKTLTGIPAGTKYTVTETEDDKDSYTTVKSGDTGTITAGEALTASFTNTKNSGSSTSPGGPITPPDPIALVDPVDPTGPENPEKPTSPTTSIKPTKPTNSVVSVDPEKSDKPSRPKPPTIMFPKPGIRLICPCGWPCWVFPSLASLRPWPLSCGIRKCTVNKK